METVLVIDDDEDLRFFLCTILLDCGYVAWGVSCPAEAFDLLKREEVDAIISDLDMPFTQGEDQRDFEFSMRVGIGAIRELMWVFPFKPIVAMSALPALVLDEVRRELGTVPLIEKPFKPEYLIETLQRQLSLKIMPLEQ